MKKLLFALVCFVICYVNLNAQQNFQQVENNNLILQQLSTKNSISPTSDRPSLIKVYSNNNVVKTIKYKYNQTGDLLAELTQISNVIQYRTTYSYDKSRIIQKMIDTLYNNTFQNFERYNYLYGSDGNLSTELIERKIENNWLNHLKNNYNYDPYGNLLSKTTKKWKNGSWENHIQYQNIFDGQNHLLNQTFCNWLNNNWVYNSSISYCYDNSGLLLSKANNIWWNGTWVKMDRNRFQYNRLGYMISYFYETYNSDNLWNTIESFNCVNDSTGNLLTASKYESFGNNYNLETERFEYKYDTNNNCISASHSNTIYGKMYFPFISNPPAEMDIYSNNYNNKISFYASQITVQYTSVNNFGNVLKRSSVSVL